MRSFILVFAAYLTLLALFPCQDNVVGVNASDPTVERQLTEIANHDDCPAGDHQDHCTPLCTCACCGLVMDAPPAALIVAFLPLPPRGNTQLNFARSWKSSPLHELDGQPPRV